MAQAPFNIDPALSALSIGFKNEDSSLIADSVLPIVPKDYKFVYPVYSKEQGYTVPDTKVGRKSNPGEVDFQTPTATAQCEDYALDDFVPQRDVDIWNSVQKAPGSLSPEQIAVMGTTNLLLLDRERRVANAVFNDAAHSNIYTPGSWATSVNYNQIMRHLDVPLVRPNTLVLGQEAWTLLRTNSAIVSAVKAINNGGSSIERVSREQVAALFEIKQVLVGSSRVNLAKLGGTPNLARTWANHAAFIYVSEQAAMFDQPCTGFTGQFGSRIAGRIPDQKRGILGGTTVRVGMMQKEVIVSTDCSIYYKAVV